VSRRSRGSFVCPNCGTDVPANAASCPGCGADDDTGWKDDPETEAQGIAPDPMTDEDYDDYVRSDFGGEKIETKGPSAWGFFLVVLLIGAVAALLGLVMSTGNR
jgi:hypothetical protein